MERPTSASAFADRRMLILFLTIFIDLMGFGIFIPVVPIYARELQRQ
jgi:hypothetical protein